MKILAPFLFQNYIQLKGCGQERPLDFSLKSNMAKTAPNFACQFVYTCRELPCTYFPLFLLRIPEIKYAKTLFEARPEGASNKRIFVYLLAL